MFEMLSAFFAENEGAIVFVLTLLLALLGMASPLFVQSKPKTRLAFSTANTNRDGTGTLGTLATGTAGGARVSSFLLTCQTAAPVEDIIRLFSYNGSAYSLLAEWVITPQAASATRAGFRMSFAVPAESRDLATTSDLLKLGTHIGNSYQAEITISKFVA